MDASPLIRRLRALRATVRRRLVAYGACAVAAGGVAAFLTIVGLDWLLHLPPVLRVVVAGLFLAGFVGATAHWIVRPLCTRIGVDAVAARLERHFDALDDRLLSAVNFLEQRDVGSASMMQRVVASTEALVEQLKLGSALTIRPLVVRGAVLAASGVVVLVVLLGSPGWARVGLYRYLDPWGPLEWPRSVQIQPITRDVAVALGESAPVSMKVTRGLHESLRGVVHLREPEGKHTTLAMQREPDGVYRATIDAITSDLQYWFEAGDDDNERAPFTIRSVRRPEVVEALVHVEPPPYAIEQPTRVHDLRDGPVSAPIGGRVRVSVRASKAISDDATGAHVGLRLVDGSQIPLIVDAQNPLQLAVEIRVLEDLRFRIELRDADGFVNSGASEYTIRASPDAAPTVSILEPRSVVEVTPQGSIPLLIRVNDDFGIAALDLEITRLGAENGGPESRPLSHLMQPVAHPGSMEAIARYVWNLNEWSLSPGEMLLYTALATDNDSSNDTAGKVGRSATMRVRVISDVEFDVRLRSDLAILEARVREAVLEQAGLLDRTTALRRHGDDAPSLTDAERESAVTLARQEANLVRKVRELAGRFRGLIERMEQNIAGDEDSRRAIAKVADGLYRVAGEAMTSASGSLGEVRERHVSNAQQQALRQAGDAQERAVAELQALLRVMSQWGSFHEMLTKSRDLLERQIGLREETADIGSQMLGKSIDALTEDEIARLKRTERRQEQLARDLARLFERMERLSATPEKDPTGAEAIDNALRQARAFDVAGQVDAATEAIRSNRTAVANVAQKAAAEGMRKMVAALRHRDDRELEELRKRLERAEDQVAALIEQQEMLRAATIEAELTAAGPAVMEQLADQQRALKQDGNVVASELSESQRTAGASGLIRRAVVSMGDAESYLREHATVPANVSQEEALTLLREALRDLERLRDEAEQEIMRRTLAQIREELEQMLAVQREIRSGVAELIDATSKRGRVGRSEARMAGKLARTQAELQTAVVHFAPDFEQVVVYQWALQRVAGWMDACRIMLDTRRIGVELLTTNDRIVRELETLIQAITATEALPIDAEFVESDGGGDAGGEAAQGKPVPTVAELLVLKAMQEQINERTRNLHDSFDARSVTEEGLQEFAVLGEDQAEVRDLADKLTQRARQSSHP